MNLDAVNLDALCLVKLSFGKCFCYFEANHLVDSLPLQFYLDANCVPVSKRVKLGFIG